MRTQWQFIADHSNIYKFNRKQVRKSADKCHGGYISTRYVCNQLSDSQLLYTIGRSIKQPKSCTLDCTPTGDSLEGSFLLILLVIVLVPVSYTHLDDGRVDVKTLTEGRQVAPESF